MQRIRLKVKVKLEKKLCLEFISIELFQFFIHWRSSFSEGSLFSRCWLKSSLQTKQTNWFKKSWYPLKAVEFTMFVQTVLSKYEKCLFFFSCWRSYYSIFQFLKHDSSSRSTLHYFLTIIFTPLYRAKKKLQWSWHKKLPQQTDWMLMPLRNKDEKKGVKERLTLPWVRENSFWSIPHLLKLL